MAASSIHYFNLNIFRVIRIETIISNIPKNY